MRITIMPYNIELSANVDNNRIISNPVNIALSSRFNKIVIYTSGCIVCDSGGGAWGGITGTLADQTDLQNALNAKVDKVAGKELSTNDYTTLEKQKLAGIAVGAQVNIIETIKVNGVALSPTLKAVDIIITQPIKFIRRSETFYAPSYISYLAFAPDGSLETDAVWTITKRVGSDDGTIISNVQYFNKKWTERGLL